MDTSSFWIRKLESFDCDLIRPDSTLDLETKQKLFLNNVEVINLELDSYCNRQCVYCPVKTYSRNFKARMNEQILDGMLDDLATINYNKKICLNLYNEPLYDIDFAVSKIQAISKKLPDAVIVTNSNGDFLTGPKLTKLAAGGLQKLNITIHPPKGKNWYYSREKESVIKFLKKIGCINVPILEDTPTRIVANTKIKKMTLTVQSVNWSTLGNSRGETTDAQKLVKIRNQPCVKPFREFTVFFDGTVTQCCDAFYSPDYTENRLTNLSNGGSVFDIYNSKIMRRIRLEVFDWSEKSGICATCAAPDLSTLEDKHLRTELMQGAVFNG